MPVGSPAAADGALPRLVFARAGAGAGDVVLDVDLVLEHGAFVEGQSGSGKTTLERLMLEQFFGHVQLVVFDVEAELLDLRSERRPFLLLGRGRDVELPPTEPAVRAIAAKLADTQTSVLVDLSEYDDEEQQLIVATVCDVFARLPEGRPGDTLLFLPELQEFAPEGGGRGTALAAVTRLAKRGRKRGARLIADSQRVSDVAKRVITQLKIKVIGATDRSDVKRAGEELGLALGERDALMALETGEFFVKAPGAARHAVRVRAPAPETVRPRRRRGERPAPPAAAPAEIAALAAALREDAQGAARDAAAAAHTGADGEPLRARAAALERELAEARAGTAEAVRVAVARALATEADRLWADLRPVVDELPARLRGALGRVDDAPPPPPVAVQRVAVQPVAVQHAAPALAGGSAGDGAGRRSARPAVVPPARTDDRELMARPDVEIPASLQRVLDAVATLRGAGAEAPSVVQVALVAGVSHTTGTFKQYVRDLGAAGLLERRPGSAVALTAAGRRRAAALPALRDRAQLHQLWYDKLPGPRAAMLRALVEAYPRPVARDALGTGLGKSPTTGTFKDDLRKLRGLGLVDFVPGGAVVATALLFPAGLP